MLAALITEKETLELLEFDEPEPRPDQVVVDITYCGICGTDVHSYQTPGPANPSTCGHEWVGTISDRGRDVARLDEGDRVVIAVPPSCGTCAACHAGRMDKCKTVLTATVGQGEFASPHGGFAPRLAVHHGRAIRANPALTDEQAAQIEPATICFHAVRATSPRLGDVAVIQGAGPIGLSTMQWVLAAGAAQVIVVEPSAARRAWPRASVRMHRSSQASRRTSSSMSTRMALAPTSCTSAPESLPQFSRRLTSRVVGGECVLSGWLQETPK